MGAYRPYRDPPKVRVRGRHTSTHVKDVHRPETSNGNFDLYLCLVYLWFTLYAPTQKKAVNHLDHDTVAITAVSVYLEAAELHSHKLCIYAT